MDDKTASTAISVDYGIIAAINSLAIALRLVPGFDADLASKMIDTFIENPISPNIPDKLAYERVLESLRYYLKHPMQRQDMKVDNVVPLFGKEPGQSDPDHSQD